MKRLFSIWNRGYKRCTVVADDIEEALKLCLESGHIRRSNAYRKFEDVTDFELTPGGAGAESLTLLLSGEKSGCAHRDDAGAWALI